MKPNPPIPERFRRRWVRTAIAGAIWVLPVVVAILCLPLAESLAEPGRPAFAAGAWAGAILAGGMIVLVLLLHRLQERYARGRSWRRESAEERFSNFMRGSLQGMLVHRDLKPLFANQALAEMLGYGSPEEIVRLESLAELIHPGDRQTVIARSAAASRPGAEPRRAEMRGVRKDGTPVLLETLFLGVSWEGRPAVQATFFDITERRQAEEKLRLSEISYRTLFEINSRILEHSPAGIILLDHDLRVVYENPGVKQLLGVPAGRPESNVGLKLQETPVFRGARMAPTLANLARGRKIAAEIQLRSQPGRETRLSVKGDPILEDGRLTGAVVLVTDISERHRHEEALRKQDLLLKALAEARSHLLSNTDRETALRGALAALGRHAGVASIVLYENHPVGPEGEAGTSLIHEWHADPSHSRIGKGEFHSISYRASGFLRWPEEMAAGHTIHGLVSEFPESERAFLEKEGIRSLMGVPIFARTRLWGFIAFVDRQSERRWSGSEEAILVAVAESLGFFLERTLAEAELRAGEERFRNLIEGSIEGILIHQDFKYLFVNQAYADLFGYSSPEEMYRIPDTRLLYPPEERRRIEGYKNARMRGEEAPTRYEFQAYRKDGSIIWGESVNRRITWQGQPAIQATVVDITERKRAEQELRASEERYHGLARNLPGMVFQFLLRPDGTRCYPYVSPVTRETLGLEPELLARDAEPLLRIIHPADRLVFERVMRESARTLQPKRWEGRYVRPDGSQAWARVMARPTRRENGDLLWDGLLLDVTREKEAELALLRRRRHESLTVPLGRIAGNLLALLGSQRDSFARIRQAAAEAGRPAAWEGALSAATASWERASELVGELGELTRAEPSARTLIAFAELLREVIGHTLRGTDIRYTLRIPDDLAPVVGELDPLSDVLNDLLLHELIALWNGGELLVEAENVRIASPRPQAPPPGAYIRVQLKGQAAGGGAEPGPWPLPADFPSRLEQVRPSLDRVREVIEAHGGWIDPEPREDGAGGFLFYLPAASTAVTGTAPAPRAQPPARERILIVEGDPQARKRFRQALRGEGYAVAFAADGEGAAARYRNGLASGRPFAAVVVGGRSLDGELVRACLELLREVDPAVRMIAAPATAEPSAALSFREAGFLEVVVSPFRLGNLRDALGRACRGQG